LRRRFREHPYTTILLLVFVVGTLFSLVARLTFMAPTDSKPLTIAVVGPMSGSEEEVGRSLLNGTQLYLDWINRRHLVDGYHFVTRAIDTTKGGVDVDALAGEEGVIGVVGHWQLDAARAAAARYNRARLPAVMPAVWPGVRGCRRGSAGSSARR
jgi:potassium efflux system protein